MTNFRPPCDCCSCGSLYFWISARFWTNGGLPICFELTNYKIHQQLFKQNPNLKGSVLRKICQLLYRGPHVVSGNDQKRGLPIGPKCTNLNNFKQFLVKIQIERGLVCEKNATHGQILNFFNNFL